MLISVAFTKLMHIRNKTSAESYFVPFGFQRLDPFQMAEQVILSQRPQLIAGSVNHSVARNEKRYFLI